MKPNDIDFDMPFKVVDGKVYSVDHSVAVPDEVFYDPDKYGEANDLWISSDNWEPLTGFTNQYGYRGACLHPSEFIGGGLEAEILNNDGIYVTVCVYSLDNPSIPSEDGYGEPDGWAVLKQIEDDEPTSSQVEFYSNFPYHY
jgi:hypothetical protein